MTKMNAKIKTVTHEYLMGQMESGETVDDTLQRLLGIGPDPDEVDQGMGAYLPDDLRAEIEELHSFIRTLGAFELEYEPSGGRRAGDAIQFTDENTGITIAQLTLKETSYSVEYRDANGEMEMTGHGIIDQSVDVDLDRVKEDAEKHIKGAIRRWGE